MLILIIYGAVRYHCAHKDSKVVCDFVPGITQNLQSDMLLHLFLKNFHLRMFAYYFYQVSGTSDKHAKIKRRKLQESGRRSPVLVRIWIPHQ